MPRHNSKQHQLGELGLHQLPGQLLTDEDFEAERWYDAQPEWPEESVEGLRGTKSEWTEVAGEALASASRMFEERVGKSSTTPSSARRGLTTSDKVATYTLSVQESPVHRLDELQTLLSFSQKRGQERTLSLEALKDLFINNLLPDNRRLISLNDREFCCERSKLSKRHLVYALFESELKTIYREFVQILEECGRDNLRFIKQKSLKTVFDLLVAKPENEKMLLSIMVNKLGDPDKCISSAASHDLSKLISEYHPQMRGVVVREVVQLLRRPNINRRAQYYAVCFLNQIPFREEDTELARTIVTIYMDLFVMCQNEKPAQTSNEEKTASDTKLSKKKHSKKKMLKKKQKQKQTAKEISLETRNSRFMASLLLGVNRAFPFTKPEQDDTSYEKHFDNLFRVVHAESFGPATQALALLLQISQSNSVQNDRLYQALYERMFDAPESGERIQASFLNLVLKAMMSDTDSRRVKAFVKRLMQSAMCGSSAYAGACLIVLFEWFRKSQHGVLTSFLSLPENDDEEEIFFDVDKFKEDDDAINKGISISDDDSDEPGSEVDQPNGKNEEWGTKNSNPKRIVKAIENGQSTEEAERQLYDPSKRDPKYARAERSSLWEAVGLSAHYHPSVSMFATTLCKDLKRSEVSGDPLRDYSLITFLDRFCYKRSKNRIKKSLYGKRSSKYRDDPVANSSEFQQLGQSGKVAVDDEFLAKYFNQNPNRIAKDGKDDMDSGSDVDSEEEAYDMAIEAEMRRLGADASLFGNRGPDVDEEDEDELKAFEKAFENEILDSDDEKQEDDDVGVPGGSHNENEEDDSDNDSDEDEDDEIRMGHQKKRKQHTIVDYDEDEGKKSNGPNMSIFAAAEDYEDAINEELEAAKKAEQEMESLQQTGPVNKRRRTESEGRLKKKRRRSSKGKQ